MHTIYFEHARIALKYGLLNLGLKPNDELLLPGYICNVIISQIYSIGVKPVYYNINDNFLPDYRHLKKLTTRKTKAILLMNYFGLYN